MRGPPAAPTPRSRCRPTSRVSRRPRRARVRLRPRSQSSAPTGRRRRGVGPHRLQHRWAQRERAVGTMFAIAPGVTITEFDAALSGRYLLRTPKGSFMLSRSSVELIRSLEGKASLEHIARSPAEAQALEKFLDEHVIPTGVFGRPDDRPRAKQPGRPQVAYVYAVRELVSAQTLRHGTEVFKHLFRPCPALLILTLSVLAQASFWWLNRGLRLEHISVEEYAVGAFLFLLTLPFHELGHGSACRHFRCEHGAMGFAMYLVF